MANRSLFSATHVAARAVPVATARNDAGGAAYAADPAYALALYACTGTFNGTFYASAEDHLARVKALLTQVDDVTFVAKVAVYAREKAHMKDVPAFLLAHVMDRDTKGDVFTRAFPRVVDTGKMACTFWQVVRSGAAGRKSLGSRPKRVWQRWFEALSDDKLFRTSIGAANPSIADVIRVVHPRPGTPARKALYGYLSGRNADANAVKAEDLPPLVQAVEAFKADPAVAPVPDVSFQLLASLPLTTRHWTEIALQAPWQALRMNLNTFQRHGVLQDEAVVRRLAARLADPDAIGRARVFPYQILVAYLTAAGDLPRPLVDALHDAMELATLNVPAIAGRVVVCPDVSGSMASPVTGVRPGASSKVRCVDVAALFTASLLRKNPGATVLPFEGNVVPFVRLEPRDSVMTNAQKLAAIGGGATNCAAPLAALNAARTPVDAVIFISDYESWVGAPEASSDGLARARPGMAVEWAQLVVRNPKARLVCIDLTPRTTRQVQPTRDTLCVGGFGDEVFTVTSQFLDGAFGREAWLQRIAEVEL